MAESDLGLTLTDRALQLLVELVRDGRPLTAKELAQRVALPPSTTYRHLETLKAWGLIANAGRGEAIELGPAAMLIARHFDRPERLLNIARPAMQELMLAADESVGLMAVIGRDVVCVDMIESDHPLRCSYAPGRSQPLTRGASAKALLAAMSEGRRTALLSANLADRAARHQLAQELALTQRRGFAESEGKVDQAVWGVSVPISGASGRLDAALTLMAPSERARPRRDELIALTRRAAAQINRSLRGVAEEDAA